MSRLLLLLVSLLLLSALGCGRSQDQNFKIVPLNQQFALQVNEEARIPDEGLALLLRPVNEDSRCPEGAVCVAAGNAKVLVDITKTDQPTATIELNTNPLDGPADRTYLAYTVKLISLSSSSNPNNYIASLSITKNDVVRVEPGGSIYGTVLFQGVGLADVALSLNSGPTLTTDPNGKYSLGMVPQGTYTITPSKSGYLFTPNSATVTIVNYSDAKEVDFTASTAL